MIQAQNIFGNRQMLLSYSEISCSNCYKKNCKVSDMIADNTFIDVTDGLGTMSLDTLVIQHGAVIIQDKLVSNGDFVRLTINGSNQNQASQFEQQYCFNIIIQKFCCHHSV